MSSINAVSLQGVEKSYKLYQSSLARFKEALYPGKKRYYEDFYALKGIDLEVPKGQTWAIIGLNGSGKSTLLKIICGVIQPDCGILKIEGRIAALLELGSGFNPEYTGRQNVFFAGALADVGRAEMEQRFPEIEAFAEIGDFIDQPVKSYSSGMLMRLAFAVAVNVTPDILVVDEALAVGDARFQHKCMKKINSFKGRSTMLLVTHDMNAVLTLCDKAVWLHEGNLVAVGEPKKIVDRYTQAVYEGSEAVSEVATAAKFTVSDKTENHSLSEASVLEDAVEVSDSFDSFGTRQIKFTHVALISKERGPVSAIYGGESVVFYTWLESGCEIKQPIVSFGIKSRLGVEIFGFNNVIIAADTPVVPKSARLLVKFEFVWPRIAPDHYAISIAVTEGNLERHITHHWVHDILIVDVLSLQKFNFGLVAVEKATMDIQFISD